MRADVKHLRLEATPVAVFGPVQLKTLIRFEELNLRTTLVTDDGLEHLNGRPVEETGSSRHAGNNCRSRATEAVRSWVRDPRRAEDVLADQMNISLD